MRILVKGYHFKVEYGHIHSVHQTCIGYVKGRSCSACHSPEILRGSESLQIASRWGQGSSPTHLFTVTSVDRKS